MTKCHTNKIRLLTDNIINNYEKHMATTQASLSTKD
jgi:hypothetical protein